MKSPTTKSAAAAVIIIAALIVMNPFGGDGTNAAWARLVEKVQQSHSDYVKKLAAAVKAKDTEKIEFYADMLDEFWQRLGWLARAKSDPENRAQMIAEAKAASGDRDAPELLNLQPTGDVGQSRGTRKIGTRRNGRRERSQHRVTRAGVVVHAARNGL